MKSTFTLMLAMLAGAAFGVAFTQVLQAKWQPKVFTITGLKWESVTSLRSYLAKEREVISAAGGSIKSQGGGTYLIDGAAPPSNVAIVEWDSLEKARAFYGSPAWGDLAAMRGEVQTMVRRYAVEERD